MTTEEHLKRIADQCRELLRLHEGLDGYFTVRQHAGWLATITACELALVLCKPVGTLNEPARHFINEILAAWPAELL